MLLSKEERITIPRIGATVLRLSSHVDTDLATPKNGSITSQRVFFETGRDTDQLRGVSQNQGKTCRDLCKEFSLWCWGSNIVKFQ